MSVYLYTIWQYISIVHIYEHVYLHIYMSIHLYSYTDHYLNSVPVFLYIYLST